MEQSESAAVELNPWDDEQGGAGKWSEEDESPAAWNMLVTWRYNGQGQCVALLELSGSRAHLM